MAIKFICSCGKRLRARDEMAARRSVCPRCGSPVGIPSLQPTHRGATAGPMSPAERLQARQRQSLSPNTPADQTPIELPVGPVAGLPPQQPNLPPATGSGSGPRRRLDTSLVRLIARTSPRSYIYRDDLETHWHECLLYPFFTWRFVFVLALGMAVLTSVVSLALPEGLDEPLTVPVWILLLYLPCLALPLLIVGNVCGWLECILRSALAGEVKYVRWPGRDLRQALKSCATWTVCFLSGPVVAVGVGLLYWIHCGDPTVLDSVILAELNILAVGYGLLALLAVSRKGRLRDANPERIADLLRRLGYLPLIPILVTAVLLPVHVLLVLSAVEELHRNAAAGALLLVLYWSSSLFWAVFLFRWLGVSVHRQFRARKKRRVATVEETPTS
jgi:hypothetical protein